MGRDHDAERRERWRHVECEVDLEIPRANALPAVAEVQNHVIGALPAQLVF
jgi:hypothetical protein